MNIDLSVEFCGVKFKNPFLVASCTASRPEKWGKIAQAGWAGASTWGLSALGNGRGIAWMALPSDFEYIEGPDKNWCLQMAGQVDNVDHSNPMSPELVEKCVRQAKQSCLPVIANIIGGFETKPWINASKAAEKAGANILELNFSAPARLNLGFGVGRGKDYMTQIIKAVKAHTKIPVMPKLSGQLWVGQLKEYAQAAVNSGADAISITNAFVGMAGVDIETAMPRWMLQDTNGRLRGYTSGLCGPAIKPLALRAVAEVASAVNVPISAIGGITTWQSAVEFMMLGARTVQIGTGVITFGYSLVSRMLDGLKGFMQRKNYQTIDDFVGITTQRYFVGEDYTTPVLDQPRHMIVDEALCNGCGKCFITCDANSYNAITIEQGVARIADEKCVKCNMCMLVCPQKAITMEWRV